MSAFLGQIAVLTVTITAAADIKAKQFVKYDGNPAGDGELVYGIAHFDAKAGDDLTLTLLGIEDLIAPAPIALGDWIASDANGHPKTTTDASIAFGRCNKAATAAGERCSILIR